MHDLENGVLFNSITLIRYFLRKVLFALHKKYIAEDNALRISCLCIRVTLLNKVVIKSRNLVDCSSILHVE